MSLPPSRDGAATDTKTKTLDSHRLVRTRVNCHPELVLSGVKDLAKDLLFQAFGGCNDEILRLRLRMTILV